MGYVISVKNRYISNNIKIQKYESITEMNTCT